MNPFKWLSDNIRRDLETYKAQELITVPEPVVETRQISEAENFVKSLPADYQATGFRMLQELHRANTDPTQFGLKVAEFTSFLKHAYGLPQSVTFDKAFNNVPMMQGSSELYGFKPAGTKLWQYFPNPFEVYTYVAEHHNAVRQCIDLIRQAIEEDGFYLIASKGTKDVDLQRAYDLLQKFNVEELRVELAIHLQLFGNAWIEPVAIDGRVRNLKRLKLLYPCHLIPVFDRDDAQVKAYVYEEGRKRTVYSKDDLLHLMLPGIDTDQLGSPPLTSAITLIETAFHAANFNNTIFYKGGLIGHILSIANPNANSTFSAKETEDWTRSVQEQLQYLHSGAQGGQGLVAMANVDKVHKITDIGALDSNWKEGTMRTDKIVAQLLGIPSEKIGIPRSAAAQYQPELVENVINSQFDSTINRLTRKVDRFINRRIIQDLLHIEGIKLLPSGRYGAMTLAAATTILTLAQAGRILTVNEARERILGWEPLPPDDPRGRLVLDISEARKIKEGEAMLPDLIAPERIDPELAGSFDTISRERHAIEKQMRIKVGGQDDGYLYKPKQSR